jgi:hypothetical protein
VCVCVYPSLGGNPKNVLTQYKPKSFINLFKTQIISRVIIGKGKKKNQFQRIFPISLLTQLKSIGKGQRTTKGKVYHYFQHCVPIEKRNSINPNFVDSQ